MTLHFQFTHFFQSLLQVLTQIFFFFLNLKSWVSHLRPESCCNVSAADKRHTYRLFCHHWEQSSVTPRWFLFVSTRPSSDRTTGPMQSCLADHFTLAALCYLLIRPASLHSIAFTSHSFSLTALTPPSSFSLYFRLPTQSRKQFTCQAEGSVFLSALWFNWVCVFEHVCAFLRYHYADQNALSHPFDWQQFEL